MFLVVTPDDFKMIQIVSVENGIVRDDISDLIKRQLGKKLRFFEYNGGYSDGKLYLPPGVYIDPQKTEDRRHLPFLEFGPESKPKFFNNCKLIEANQDLADYVLKANIERVNYLRDTAKRVTSIISGHF